ncbi:MAG: methyltransferase domain-containing protein [Planctomycetota bacterium]
MIALSCTVRGCESPLARGERAFACARGHSFDVAKSGYVNLLQPQDRRSKSPGDSKDVVAARRRFLDAGHGAFLLDALAEELAARGVSGGARIVDLGCGEGFFLGGLRARVDLDALGIDISTPAIDAAARRHRDVTWIVANADRRLPLADASIDVVLSVNGRRNAGEVARVLAPNGVALFAIPAVDDQAELRERVLGRADTIERVAPLTAEMEPHFDVVHTRTVRAKVALERAALDDLLATTYRGARHKERGRMGELGALDVTWSADLVRFRRRG